METGTKFSWKLFFKLYWDCIVAGYNIIVEDLINTLKKQ